MTEQVTDAMIEAGAKALSSCDYETGEYTALTRIYLAMQAANTRTADDVASKVLHAVKSAEPLVDFPVPEEEMAAFRYGVDCAHAAASEAFRAIAALDRPIVDQASTDEETDSG